MPAYKLNVIRIKTARKLIILRQKRKKSIFVLFKFQWLIHPFNFFLILTSFSNQANAKFEGGNYSGSIIHSYSFLTFFNHCCRWVVMSNGTKVYQIMIIIPNWYLNIFGNSIGLSFVKKSLEVKELHHKTTNNDLSLFLSKNSNCLNRFRISLM